MMFDHHLLLTVRRQMIHRSYLSVPRRALTMTVQGAWTQNYISPAKGPLALLHLRSQSQGTK